MSDNLRESASLKTNIDKYSEINPPQKKESIFELVITIIIIIIFISTLIYYIFICNNPEQTKIDLYANERKNSGNAPQSQEEKNCPIGYFAPSEINDNQCIKCQTENCAKCSGTTKNNICTKCQEDFIPVYEEKNNNNNKLIKACVKNSDISEIEKKSSNDKNDINVGVNCNIGFKLENGKCILNYSFKAIYKTHKNEETIILIHKNYINEIIELIIDNKNVTPSYNYTFSKGGEHEVLMLLNTNNLETNKMMFYNISNLISINFTNLFDTSNILNMKGMFKDCLNLNILNISVFNTNKVTDFSFMFDNCTSLTSIDLSSINPKNAYDISYMFSNCISLSKISLKSFNTINVIDMTGLFYGCSSLTSIDDINNLKTNKTKYMLYMFNGCSSLTSLEINSFEANNVKDMSYMLKDCLNLKNIELSNLATNNVTSLEGMFMGCSKLTKVDLKNWNVEKVKNINKLFYGCESLNNIDISCFKESADGKSKIFDEKIGKNGEIIIDKNFYNQTKNIIPSDWKIIHAKKNRNIK